MPLISENTYFTVVTIYIYCIKPKMFRVLHVCNPSIYGVNYSIDVQKYVIVIDILDV